MYILDENTPNAENYEVLYRGQRVTDRVVSIDLEQKVALIEDGYLTTFTVVRENAGVIGTLENEFVAFLDDEGKPQIITVSGEAFDEDIVVFNKFDGANLVPDEQFFMDNAKEFLKYRGAYTLVVRDAERF